MTIKTTFFAAAVAFTIAGAASAATIVNGGDLNAGDDGIGNAFLASDSVATFTYTALEDLRVRNFVSVSSTGLSAADLASITFGITGDAGVASGSYGMGDITMNGASFEAGSSLPGFILEAGQSFTLSFNYADSGVDVTSNQYRFDTSAVPVPAGVLLLGTALGGLGFARRRKAQKAA